MKKILSAAALALAFAVTVGAQATPSSQPATPGADQASKAHKAAGSKSVTLTGCLRQGDTPDSFALDNAQMSRAESGTSGSAAGSASSPSTGASPSTPSGTPAGMSAGMSGAELGSVKLMSTADIDLKAHVGHRVQVTGTMAGGKSKDKSSGASSDTMGSGSGASPSSATAKDKEGAHSLKVRALRHVSETCPQ